MTGFVRTPGNNPLSDVVVTGSEPVKFYKGTTAPGDLPEGAIFIDTDDDVALAFGTTAGTLAEGSEVAKKADLTSLPVLVTPTTADLDTVLAAAATAGRSVFFGSGTYTRTTGMTYAAMRHSWIAQGRVVLDFTGLASGYAVTVAGRAVSGSAPRYEQINHTFKGFYVAGPSADATTTDGFSLDDTSLGAQVNFENVYVTGFRDQYVVDRNSYNIKWDKCAFARSKRRGLSILTTANGGEMISLYGCIFADHGNLAGDAVAIYFGTEGDKDVSFYGCSFDYSDTYFDIRSGIANLYGCHLESSSSALSAVRLSYTSGKKNTVFNVFGGKLYSLITTPPGLPAMIECTSGDSIFVGLHGPRVDYWNQQGEVVKVTAGNPKIYWGGGGELVTTGGPDKLSILSRHLNQVSNGDWELGTTAGWFINGSYTYSVQSTTKHAGTYALKITGTGSQGTGAITQTVPCAPNSQVVYGAWMKGEAITGGSVTVRISWLRRDGSQISVISGTTTNQVTTNQDFLFMGSTASAPQGAYFASVQLYAASLNGSVYVDGVVLNSMSGLSTGSGLVLGTTTGTAAAGNDTRIANALQAVGAVDHEITDATKGVILKAPGGTRYRITVADGGTLTTTAL